ncbi:MAG: hypothetical protein ORN49_06295, partial [Rhodobacteraceae bacterium]|nr:hypothetical protein [Paracoccaceae bacterium]
HTASVGLFALSQLADMVVWCVNASSGWQPEDARLWDRVPRHLQRRSVLALTHTENLDESSLTALVGTIATVTQGRFAAICPIATALAWTAVQGNLANPEEVWLNSGADDLFNGIMQMAASLREAENTKIARIVAEKIAPLLARLPDPVMEAPPPPPPQQRADPIVVPSAVHAAQPPTPPSLDNLATWQVMMHGLRDRVAEGTLDNGKDFLAACLELVTDFTGHLVADTNGFMLPDWLRADFEQAHDLLVLMQYEEDDRVSHTAAHLMVQLTEALSWAAPPQTAIAAA